MTLRDKQGLYGNDLVSRIPVTRVHRLDISVAQREPGGVVEMKLYIRNGLVKVVTILQGLRTWEHRYQIEDILSLLAETGVFGAILLLSYINLWSGWSHPIHQLNKTLKATPAHPRRLPVLALDRMWTRPATEPPCLAPSSPESVVQG
jgi:hypothetical protein